MISPNAVQLITEERIRQDKKWGEQNHDDLYWLGILMEEVGELSKAIIEFRSRGQCEGELVQVAAVAVAWLECLERIKESYPGKAEEVR
jgi:NTP pyrophosphatase (non-canonical NTP hydrolase)